MYYSLKETKLETYLARYCHSKKSSITLPGEISSYHNPYEAAKALGFLGGDENSHEGASIEHKKCRVKVSKGKKKGFIDGPEFFSCSVQANSPEKFHAQAFGDSEAAALNICCAMLIRYFCDDTKLALEVFNRFQQKIPCVVYDKPKEETKKQKKARLCQRKIDHKVNNGVSNVIVHQPKTFSLKDYLNLKGLKKFPTPSSLMEAAQGYLDSDLISSLSVVETHLDVNRNDFKFRVYSWVYEVFECFIDGHGLLGAGVVSCFARNKWLALHACAAKLILLVGQRALAMHCLENYADSILRKKPILIKKPTVKNPSDIYLSYEIAMGHSKSSRRNSRRKRSNRNSSLMVEPASTKTKIPHGRMPTPNSSSSFHDEQKMSDSLSQYSLLNSSFFSGEFCDDKKWTNECILEDLSTPPSNVKIIKKENFQAQQAEPLADLPINTLLDQLGPSSTSGYLDVISNFDVNRKLFNVKIKLNEFFSFYGTSEIDFDSALKYAAAKAVGCAEYLEKDSKVIAESCTDIAHLVHLVENQTGISHEKLKLDLNFEFETRTWKSQLLFNENMFCSENCETQLESVKQLLMKFLVEAFGFSQV